MRPTVQRVISDTIQQNNAFHMLALKNTAKGSFPAIGLEYKNYNLAPEYILARRMKEYLYHPGRTTDVGGVVPPYLSEKFEQMYANMHRPSPMVPPSDDSLREKRMINTIQNIFYLEQTRRSISARQRPPRPYHDTLEGEGEEGTYIPSSAQSGAVSLFTSPTGSPKRTQGIRTHAYPDTNALAAYPYCDKERQEFLAQVEAGNSSHYFRLNRQRALPCPSTNAATSAAAYMRAHFYCVQ